MPDPTAGDPLSARGASSSAARTAPGAGAREAAARRWTGVGLMVAAVLATLLTWAEVVGATPVADFDSALTDFTRGWADPAEWPVDVASLIGRLTAPFWSAAAASVLVLLLYSFGHRAAAGFLALSGVAGLVVSELFKRLLQRPRPPGAEAFVSDLDRSFPSGHAMVGIYLYLTTGLILVHLSRGTGRRWLQGLGVLLISIGPVIGLSRLVLGVHWPSDILAGWSFGSAVVCASALPLWTPLAHGWSPGPTGSHDRAPHGSAASRPPDPPGSSAPGQLGADTTPDPPDR